MRVTATMNISLPDTLKDYVKDRDGNYHDMLLKGCSVHEFLDRREAYGVN